MNIKNTIDELHKSKMNVFYEKEKTVLPELKREKHKLQKILDVLMKEITETRENNHIEQIMELRDKIKNISQEMKDILREKKNYLLKNSKDIFEYFEEKQNITSGTNAQNVSALNSFFKIKSTNDQGSLSGNRFMHYKKLYKNYWKNVNNEIVDPHKMFYSSDICEFCNMGEMISQDEEGVLICNNRSCGKFITYIDDNTKQSNKEPPNEVSYTAYIRLNHFKEILSQFQAKETTQIPIEVIDAIKSRLKKERITDLSKINYKVMRDILRKMGLNKYFEHIQYINSLFGVKPPTMDDKLTETLCILFIEIQQPWSRHCPPDRVNFFNYTYTLYQLCVLLDQPQYLPYIPLLKDSQKQQQQDSIWKLVCKDLDWCFFSTV
jgi:hypothetical protein